MKRALFFVPTKIKRWPFITGGPNSPIQITPRDMEFSAFARLHNLSLLHVLAQSFSSSYQWVLAGHCSVTAVTRVRSTEKRLRCLSYPVYMEKAEMRLN